MRKCIFQRAYRFHKKEPTFAYNFHFNTFSCPISYFSYPMYFVIPYVFGFEEFESIVCSQRFNFQRKLKNS